MTHRVKGTRRIGRKGNFDVYEIDDSFTRRAKAKQESINNQLKNQSIAIANRDSAFKSNLIRQGIRARASNRAANERKLGADTNSSKLLIEFESRRSQARSLAVRDQSQRIGQIEAGFGASGVSTIGASLEQARQSALKRIIQESQFNSQKEGILNIGRSASTSAKATSIINAGNTAAVGVKAKLNRSSINTFNPFESTKAFAEPSRLPFIQKGF